MVSVFFALTVLLLSGTASAETLSPETTFSWEYLASSAGAATATLLIVQYTKAMLDRVFKIPTRAYAYAIAFLLSLGGTAFGAGGMTFSDVPPIMLNALVVAFTAMGAYEATYKKRGSETA